MDILLTGLLIAIPLIYFASSHIAVSRTFDFLIRRSEVRWKAEHLLHEPAQQGYVHVVKVLLLKGVDPNATDERERTALHYAMEKADVTVSKLLIAKGGDVTMRDEDGVSPLDLLVRAIKSGQISGHVAEELTLLARNSMD